jgi:hypothetical protein
MTQPTTGGNSRGRWLSILRKITLVVTFLFLQPIVEAKQRWLSLNDCPKHRQVLSSQQLYTSPPAVTLHGTFRGGDTVKENTKLGHVMIGIQYDTNFLPTSSLSSQNDHSIRVVIRDRSSNSNIVNEAIVQKRQPSTVFVDSEDPVSLSLDANYVIEMYTTSMNVVMKGVFVGWTNHTNKYFYHDEDQMKEGNHSDDDYSFANLALIDASRFCAGLDTQMDVGGTIRVSYPPSGFKNVWLDVKVVLESRQQYSEQQPEKQGDSQITTTTTQHERNTTIESNGEELLSSSAIVDIVTSAADARRKLLSARRSLQQSTPSISPSTIAPTFDEKCFVCGSEDLFVSLPYTIINVGPEVECGSLEMAGRRGLIPPTACDYVSTIAIANCECQSSTTSTTITPVPGPSMSPYPSVVPEDRAVCNLCANPEDSNNSTNTSATQDMMYIRNLTSTVEFLGRPISCLTLVRAAQLGVIRTESCPNASAIAVAGCGGCSSTAAPTHVNTRSPSLSIEPTATRYPTYEQKCFVCGSENLQILPRSSSNSTNGTEYISVNASFFSCLELQDAGRKGQLQPNECTWIQDSIATAALAAAVNQSSDNQQLGCTCIPMEVDETQSSDIPTPSLLVSDTPTLTGSDDTSKMISDRPTLLTTLIPSQSSSSPNGIIVPAMPLSASSSSNGPVTTESRSPTITNTSTDLTPSDSAPTVNDQPTTIPESENRSSAIVSTRSTDTTALFLLLIVLGLGFIPF